MTEPITSTQSSDDIIVALDLATDALAAVRVMPSEAQEGAEWSLRVLEGMPEEIRVRFAGCIDFARDTASAIIADSDSPPPWNNHELLLLCNDLTTALNAISAAIRPATTQPMQPESRRYQHKPRNPSIATQIKRVGKTGRRVTSVTTPDGFTLHLDETTPSDASNPWLVDLPKVKQ